VEIECERFVQTSDSRQGQDLGEKRQQAGELIFVSNCGVNAVWPRVWTFAQDRRRIEKTPIDCVRHVFTTTEKYDLSLWISFGPQIEVFKSISLAQGFAAPHSSPIKLPEFRHI
jgi:hypothetical protein